MYARSSTGYAVRDRGRYVVDQLLRREQHGLDQVGGHDPRSLGPGRRSSRQLVSSLRLRARSRRTLAHRLDRAEDDLEHRLARVRALSPLATLERGYAVLLTGSGDVLTSTEQVDTGDAVAARLARGRLDLSVERTIDDEHVRNPDD